MRRFRVSAAAGALSLVAACGSVTKLADNDQPSSLNVFDVLRNASQDSGRWPDSLAAGLPNHTYELGDTGRTTTFSDLVIDGDVVAAVEGEAVVWHEDETFEPVDFDDSQASERTITVTVAVDHLVGPQADTSEDKVAFRVPVPRDVESEALVTGWRDLGHVVAVLVNDPNPAHPSADFVPMLGGVLVGRVQPDGSLAFPALGADERAFVGPTFTLSRLLDAARAPKSVEQVNLP